MSVEKNNPWRLKNDPNSAWCSADDQLRAVKEMTETELRAAQAWPGNMKTVQTAIERRLRKIEKEKPQQDIKAKIIAIINKHEDELSDGFRFYHGEDGVESTADEIAKLIPHAKAETEITDSSLNFSAIDKAKHCHPQASTAMTMCIVAATQLIEEGAMLDMKDVEKMNLGMMIFHLGSVMEKNG